MVKRILAVVASVLIFTLIVAVPAGELLLSGEECEYKSCEDCIKNNCTYVECHLTSGADTYHCSKNATCEDKTSATSITNCSVLTTTAIPSSSPAEASTLTPTPEHSDNTSTESTSQPTMPTPTPSGRHFDAPSFIGGTVLSLGLLAIIYVGFKFYKARTERNYHTL